MKTIGVYSFNKRFLLVEVLFECPPDDIDWLGIYVKEEGKSEDELCYPYMEQFLDESGENKLCDAWDEPENIEEMTSCRMAFFIETGHGDVLETPFGDVSLCDVMPLPERLKEIIEYEKP